MPSRIFILPDTVNPPCLGYIMLIIRSGFIQAVPAYKKLKVSWRFTAGRVMMPKYIAGVYNQGCTLKIIKDERNDTCDIESHCWFTNFWYIKGDNPNLEY